MPNAKERRWTSSLTNIFLLMITLIKIYQYRETAGYYRSGPALEGTACGRGYKLFSLFFTSLLLKRLVWTLYIYFSCREVVSWRGVCHQHKSHIVLLFHKTRGGWFLPSLSVGAPFCFDHNRLARWSFFSSDGMVILFFQGTIAIDGFPMVLSPPNHHIDYITRPKH